MKTRIVWLFLFFILISCTSKKHTVVIKKEEIASAISSDYIIGPSDGLEISYYINQESSEYIIDTEDKLQVNFYYYPELSKTVKVRPDGFITLTKFGEVKAAGKKPRILAEEISKLCSKELSRPVVTVELVEFNVKIESLKTAVTTSDRGQSKYVLVRADGKISLPYLKEEIQAAGKTSRDLSKEIEEKYQENIKKIGITVSIVEAKSYQACVMGDVQTAGCYNLSGNTTLMQIISHAGGFTKEANLHQIVIISRDINGNPEYILKDATKIIYKRKTDPLVKQYDVIYVPRTWISKTSFTAREMWSLIPIGFQGIYDINN